MTYSTIAVLYNPKSTGSSKTMAQEFKKKLQEKNPKQKVQLIATKRAGHAETLAFKIAKKHKDPLIISSSGDGGYNEVVNGAMRAQKKGRHPVTGLLPAGNANDHFHNLHNKDIIDLIIANKTQKIDLLSISYVRRKKAKQHYAHSYIGFGISPLIGRELNKTKLNRFNEIWLVIRTLFLLHPVRLNIDGKVRKYDSIIISNVDRMSKYLKISGPSKMNDGLFEVTISKHVNKLKLSAFILQASLTKLKEDRRTDTFSLKTIRETLVQTDGEILTIDPDTEVVISIEKQVLNCIV